MIGEQTFEPVTAQEMAAIDASMDRLGLGMAAVEAAGYAIARTAKELDHGSERTRFLVLVGPTQNGLVGLTAARRLASWKSACTVLLAEPKENFPPVLHQSLNTIETFGGRVFEPGALLPESDIVIDGLLGYDHTGDPATGSAALIEATARLKVPILSIDLPSGLDATTGKGGFPTVRAATTVALGYPKEGVLKEFARPLVGRLLLADIGILPALWRQLDREPPDFRHDIILPLSSLGHDE